MKLLITLLCALATIASAEIKVAALHPLIGNLVRDVGGKNVEVRPPSHPIPEPRPGSTRPAPLKSNFLAAKV
jgi:hypothetical protein